MFQQFLVVLGLTAAIYMLLALGFTLIFGIMRVVNFAHGEFVMLGAYAVYVLQDVVGLDYFVALPLAALLVGLAGVLAEILIFRRFTGDELGSMIVALALAVSLKGAVTVIFGVEGPPISRAITGAVEIGGTLLPKDQLFAAAVAVLAVAATHLLMTRSRLGLAMRAVAQAPDVARLQGISPWRTYPAAFAIGCFLAGLAGALTAPLYSIEPHMGDAALMRAFVVVVLGGLGSIPGALIAAFVLGAVDAGMSILFNPTIAALTSFGIVIAVLIARPAGILGRA
ncbi:branched-chain amino acid ABC transporter permease [Enterovirga rhinocerotis]|uniref:Branched-chain amino acid transport system permease protein n=1 Tax=Enterovirga rhinocerotis TaxID=1339210 RepID=A0A4R7BMY6_9HYPH|nr:branched-chain amino acid ABC transporter permease [Enterovirga rhinocerotis]TDR85266.1 branched-chain amino acid transport system permease protein [Enterovirga rhinocerotis]